MKKQNDINHEDYMRRCLELAKEAKQRGNTPVGSVIVRGAKIIAEGIEGAEELPAMLAHAEVLAVLHAVDKIDSKDLSGCLLYTTVEPCFMCSYVIRQTTIRGVIFGIKAPGVGGATSDYPILSANNVSKWADAPFVEEGVLAEECKSLFEQG